MTMLKTHPELAERIQKAVEVLFLGACTDGSCHKQWAIDQALRHLLGDRYLEAIGSNAIESEWHDLGVAP